MTSKPHLPLVSLLLSGSVLISGCGLLGDGSDGDGGAPGGNGEEGGDGFAQEGYVGSSGGSVHARVEVAELARLDDRTRVTVELTSLEEEAVDLPRGGNRVRVVDPVNQQVSGSYPDIGSQAEGDAQFEPGVTYELVFYTPPLDGDTEAATVLLPGAIGGFAGIPVVDGEAGDYPTEMPDEAPEEGDTVTLPVDDSAPDPDDGETHDLHSPVGSVIQDRTVEEDRETVQLRADVLFDFDESDISEDAAKVLDEVVQDTRERVDSDDPLITISGHTDGVGDEDYNRALSEERAEAVREVLEAELGADYEYETEGRGSAEPVASEGGEDDAEARAQNRRVEISYAFDAETARESEDDGEFEERIEEIDPADAGGPGPFSTHTDGEAVTTLEGESDGTDWSVDVYPFSRDGAFLVARLETTNVGEDVSGDAGHVNVAAFDPHSGTYYLPVRVEDAENERDQLRAEPWPAAGEADTTQPLYLYLTAPPEDVASLTLVTSDIGRASDVPIEE
ncbi:outer membrane protein OmpA-like peptidoglycan-associated protein [Lipingzhangella halophila]|uniref:Outer membrane protein OmpA-like peptidoglycan-associated protein n=1 Tax=Lipingzhangella halophila TaxID=1783352 RepID=A0A7W7RF50_9ACTN|nr:OmpA family protein [Lipingzhangella halophila]MBB4930281.1 outer membrane protein OmpA-like peptidoglycan-associated protein [Lipingzhangella halophila]